MSQNTIIDIDALLQKHASLMSQNTIIDIDALLQKHASLMKLPDELQKQVSSLKLPDAISSSNPALALAHEVPVLCCEIKFLRHLLGQMLDALPTRRDWLDPSIEESARQSIGYPGPKLSDIELLPFVMPIQYDNPDQIVHFSFEPTQDHRYRAQRKHDQTLERLRERGGMGLSEMVAIMTGKPYERLPNGAAIDILNQHGRMHFVNNR